MTGGQVDRWTVGHHCHTALACNVLRDDEVYRQERNVA